MTDVAESIGRSGMYPPRAKALRLHTSVFPYIYIGIYCFEEWKSSFENSL